MLTTTDPVRVDCMHRALALARLSNPIPTAFCVGCVITKADTSDVISEGYSRELEGNTHAEQCAILKMMNHSSAGINPEGDLDLYTTMEPCSVRLSGHQPCTDLIIAFNRSHHPKLRIKNVYLGVFEPSDFVDCDGFKKLTDHGITVVQVIGLSDECLKVARGQA